MNDNKNYNCKFAFASSVSEVENECLVGESCNALDLLKNRLSQSQIIANYATWEWNSDSDRIAWSDNLFTILQYDPVEVTPSIKALFKRIHPEDLKCVHQTIQKSKKEDKTNEIEFRIILPDESIRIIYCYTSLRYDPVSKSNSSIIGTVQDITERKQAELALKESEIKFRNLVEGSLQGIFVHKDFKPLFANQKCIEMFGYESLDEILQLDSILTAFWAKEEQERIEKYKTDRMIGNKDIPIIYECKGRRKDGTEFWFENYVTTVDWDGEKAIQAAVIDISERKQADLALKESDERFRSTFEHGPLGMGTADLDGNILEVNKIFCEIFGYSENEFVKKNIRDFIHPDDGDLNGSMQHIH
jgi:PAS domain S-box-containing protein